MTISILFVLILLALLVVIFKAHKTSIGVLTISLALIVAIGCGFVPRFLLQRLDTYSTRNEVAVWGGRNGIVVLSAGNIKLSQSGLVKPSMFSYSRINKAAQLYYSCKRDSTHICKLIVSGGDPLNTGVSEANIYSSELQKLGVPGSDIILEDRSDNTYQNAKYTAQLLNTLKYDQIYLVTSGFHMKRALIYFANFGVIPTAVSADVPKVYMTLFPLSYNFVITDWILHEYLGIYRLDIYNYFGWNNSLPK